MVGINFYFMIAANELRIGNWVRFNKPTVRPTQYLQVKEIFCIEQTGEGYFVSSNQYTPININKGVFPIPLTPEIFEKCGFIKHIDTGNEFYTIGDFALHKNKEWFNHHSCNNSIDTVHQLQNLYFALTGEELKIEL